MTKSMDRQKHWTQDNLTTCWSADWHKQSTLFAWVVCEASFKWDSFIAHTCGSKSLSTTRTIARDPSPETPKKYLETLGTACTAQMHCYCGPNSTVHIPPAQDLTVRLLHCTAFYPGAGTPSTCRHPANCDNRAVKLTSWFIFSTTCKPF